MRIAFIHQNMPGQYREVMPHYAADPDNEVVAIGEADNIKRNFLKFPERLKLYGYMMPQLPEYVGHPHIREMNTHVYRGERVANVLMDLKSKGFKPDVICAHPGWGESLYIRDVFPDVRLINYCEFFYRSTGQDFGFDPEFPDDPVSGWALRVRNATQLVSMASMDAGVAPTRWQATRFPAEFQHKISVIHEGIKTDTVVPNPEAKIVFRDGNLTLTSDDEVITFVNRNFEPYRGFHTFMRALPDILKRRPKAHVLMVGGDDVSYGKKVSQGTYRQWMMNAVGAELDMPRVHFLGRLQYSDYLRVLQVATVHVYLTYPFVLSWSMLEAMSAGCLVIGSRTAPVEEVLKHEDNGLLVDFFSKEEVADTVVRACEKRKDMMDIRKRARQTIIEGYDFKTVCLPKHLQLIEKGIVPPVAVEKVKAATQPAVSTALAIKVPVEEVKAKTAAISAESPVLADPSRSAKPILRGSDLKTTQKAKEAPVEAAKTPSVKAPPKPAGGKGTKSKR